MSSDFTFEGENAPISSYRSRTILGVAVQPKMVKWLTEKGIAKSDGQAGWILFGLSVLFLVIAIIIFLYFVLDVGRTETIQYEISPEFREQMESNGNTL